MCTCNAPVRERLHGAVHFLSFNGIGQWCSCFDSGNSVYNVLCLFDDKHTTKEENDDKLVIIEELSV